MKGMNPLTLLVVIIAMTLLIIYVVLPALLAVTGFSSAPAAWEHFWGMFS